MAPHRHHARKKSRTGSRSRSGAARGRAVRTNVSSTTSAGAVQPQPMRDVGMDQPLAQQQHSPPTPQLNSAVAVVVTEFNINDIFSGRGPPMVHYEGNIRFRALIRKRRHEFTTATRRRRKSAIAHEILTTITQRGGRFLRQLEPSSLDTTTTTAASASSEGATPPAADDEDEDSSGIRWVEMDSEAALVKIKQALRHKDTSTTSAPVAAFTSDNSRSLDVSEPSAEASPDVSDQTLSSRPTANSPTEATVGQAPRLSLVNQPTVASLIPDASQVAGIHHQQQLLLTVLQQQQHQLQSDMLLGTPSLMSNNLTWLLQGQQQQQQQLMVPWQQATAATTVPQQLGPALHSSNLNLLTASQPLASTLSNTNGMPHQFNATGGESSGGRSRVEILLALQQRAQTEANLWQGALQTALLEQQQQMAVLQASTVSGIVDRMDPANLANIVLANYLPNQALLMGNGITSAPLLRPASLSPFEQNMALSGLGSTESFLANNILQQLTGTTMSPMAIAESGTTASTSATTATRTLLNNSARAAGSGGSPHRISVMDASANTTSNNSSNDTRSDNDNDEDDDTEEENDCKPPAREDAAARSSSESSPASTSEMDPSSKKRKAK